MRISKIHLKNIGVFEDETIEFREKTDPEKAEIHILTGENGTGKSTILYALADGVSFNYLLHKRFRYDSSQSRFTINFANDGSNSYEAVLGGNITQNESSKPINLYNQKKEHFYNSPYQSFNFAFFAYSGYRNTANYQINSIQEITKNSFENSLNFEKSIDNQLLIQWIANQKTNEALALASGEKNEAANYAKSIKRIEDTISNIIEKKIEFVLERNPLNVILKVDNVKLDFDVLPDGLKSILSWIADLLMRMDRIKWIDDRDIFDRNFILFLDEIEVHLHPAWQRKILPEIQKLFKNAQIFISTHSPFVVGSVDGAWVYQLENKDGNSRVAKVRLSNDGESYDLILERIFGIKEDFGEDVEKEFKEFYALREQLFKGEKNKKEEFLQKAKDLANKSLEIKNIIGSELRQLERLSKEEYAI
ncbi:MAG: AAA family ATPase [Thermoflexibacter sp.]|nr:AAA family ATPase [Thermoflexibacter sp.]